MPVPIPGRLAEILRRSTVQIRSGTGYRQGGGSGVAVQAGRVITNAHVLQSRDVVVESWEGKTVPASIVRSDSRRDLALLETKKLDLPDVPLGDSNTVKAGTPVVAIGNPLGFVGAVSSGVVHAVGSMGMPYGLPFIQADVRLAPGNSGGPLVDFKGQLIGINTMIVSGGLALAIPSRAVQAFLSRTDSPRSLGVSVRPLPLRQQQIALMILELTPGGSAESASLLPGDQLVSANGMIFRFAEDLQDEIARTPDGILRLEFYRGGRQKLRQVTVKLVSLPASSAA